MWTNKELIKIYSDMLLIRRFEEKAGQLYGMGLIGGFCHLYIGQEAVAVGIEMALKKEDKIITSYRDHGFILARGSDPEAVMAELMGRRSGCSKGKGGSMHIFDLNKGFFGGHGIVGAQASLGTGIALSLKYQKLNNVCVTVLGDGAANQGQFFESMNMAKLWNLPVLYVIENNLYAMGTHISYSCSNINFHQRGEVFNIPGYVVDGMDVFAVYKAASEAVNQIKNGGGPIVLEIQTYRYRGHSMSDPATYRTKNEVEDFKHKDPITTLHDYIIDQNSELEQELKILDKKIRDNISNMVEKIKQTPEPELNELYTDVYCN